MVFQELLEVIGDLMDRPRIWTCRTVAKAKLGFPARWPAEAGQSVCCRVGWWPLPYPPEGRGPREDRLYGSELRAPWHCLAAGWHRGLCAFRSSLPYEWALFRPSPLGVAR